MATQEKLKDLIEKLKQISSKLDSNDIDLEDAIELVSEANKVYIKAKKILDDSKMKIEEIFKEE